MTETPQEVEKAIYAAQNQLASLKEEQEGIRERLKQEALKAVEEGDSAGLVDALARREALPYLV